MSTAAVLSSLRIDAATCVRNPEKANSTEMSNPDGNPSPVR